MANFDGSEKYMEKVKTYGVNRADENFWEVYEWFQQEFDKSYPLQAGLYDLNRYYYKAW